MLIIICNHVLVNDNGILISRDDFRIYDEYGHSYSFHGRGDRSLGSQFQLCSGDNLCPESSNNCLKFEICAADYVQSRSKIRYNKAYE